MVAKLILLGIMVVAGLVAFVIKFFVPEIKYKNNPMQRIKIISRVRVGCVLIILVLLLICMFI